VELTDDLTGLWNRAAFERRLEEELARLARYGRAISIGLIEVDGPADDAVLRAVAQELDVVRCCDSLFRIGGREFALLLPETMVEGAAGLRRRLTAQLDQAGLPVTVTMGIAQAQLGEPAPVVLARAGRALAARQRLMSSHDEPTSSAASANTVS
jgi:diguanylate cyclase